MQLTIDPKVKEAGVSLAYSVIEFKNEAHNEGIWQEILNPLIQKIEEEDTLDSIKENPQILATKKCTVSWEKIPRVFAPLLTAYGGELFSKRACIRSMLLLI